MFKPKFYKCEVCGQFLTAINDKPCVPTCCGQDMKLLVPNTEDGAFEKHIPVVKQDGNVVTVQIGEELHPMLEQHHIEWVYLFTETNGYWHSFKAGDKPICTFTLNPDEKIISVYEHCNIHGLYVK